ncbi:sporulation/spore germination protein [Coleofasciculus sp. FACHB-129]|uniref:sporulation/spore germination protein n=1 Tax=Cyanophyceae TaxID=3028117 RepID=UPI001682E6CD|nr:sporulation/spore germination protein [Coleofasciculus sp. FACHB-129]MBD1894273.1 sporulation/spore germination protein [Coleofasciculus sp. FACHB-129]
MRRTKNYWVPLLTGAIVASLSSCASLPTNSERDKAGLPPAHAIEASKTTTKASDASRLLTGAISQATTTAPSKNNVTVTIYQPDTQCEALVPEKVDVSAVESVQAAVGKVLEERDTADFNLAGYRVIVNPSNRVATVDLRIAPGSQRKFVSLSSCEQFALFGSLRKTLTANSQWKIKDVRFTEQGEDISL